MCIIIFSSGVFWRWYPWKWVWLVSLLNHFWRRKIIHVYWQHMIIFIYLYFIWYFIAWSSLPQIWSNVKNSILQKPLNQVSYIFSIVGSIQIFFHNITQPSTNMLKMTSFFIIMLWFWRLHMLYTLYTSP
jgi:hypothetical protein